MRRINFPFIVLFFCKKFNIDLSFENKDCETSIKSSKETVISVKKKIINGKFKKTQILQTYIEKKIGKVNHNAAS